MKTNSDTRFEAWQIQERDFPRQGSPADKLEFLIRYAILAPSGHNTQPWKFSVSEDEIQVFADKTRWLRVCDPNQASLHIGVGCALENLLIAAEHFGYEHRVVYFPEAGHEELVAIVKLTPGGQPSPFRDASLFHAITARHTSRSTYNRRPLSKQNSNRLQQCCIEPGIWLDMIDDLESRRKVKDLLIRGHTIMMRDRAFRAETGYWVGQGIFNMPRLIARLVQFTFPYVNPSIALTMMDSRLVMSAPLVAVLSSTVNDRESQAKVGQVFERVCLAATMLGIRVQPMSATVDVSETKAQMTKLLPNPDGVPQHVFRLGYAEPVKTPAPRRPFSEILA